MGSVKQGRRGKDGSPWGQFGALDAEGVGGKRWGDGMTGQGVEGVACMRSRGARGTHAALLALGGELAGLSSSNVEQAVCL